MKIAIVPFDDKEIETILYHAKLAEIGGASKFRNREDRIANMSIDQATGQFGEAGESKLLTGSIELYVRTREKKEKTPFRGDDGTDLIGFNVDPKASRMRCGCDRMYHLWIRPREYHATVYYYLALMHPDRNNEIMFVGWALGSTVPFITNTNRYELREDKLTSVYSENAPYKVSPVAQLVERSAVNRQVVGSNPTWGAKIHAV